MKEGGRAVRQTWFPAPSYCPLRTGIWKESLDLHYVSDDNQSHRHEHHHFQCHKNYIEVTRGAVSPVILSNYPNGRFLADIVHTKCQPFLSTQTPLCRSGLPFNTMNCSWGSLCQAASVNINRKLFRNGILHVGYFQALSFSFFLLKFSLIPSKGFFITNNYNYK